MSGGRDAILARIREALKLSAPFPGEHDGVNHTAEACHDEPGSPAEIRAWLPPVGATYEERAALFARNSVDLKTTFIRFPTREAAHLALREIATAEKWSRVAFHKSKLVNGAVSALNLESFETKSGYDVNALERCDASITACDALIAQTGTVLLTTTSAGGRALSVLPPHHVVIAERAQLVPDLTAGYEFIAQKYGASLPSFITLITGPSRTGDIERILVLGAHGPKRLTVVLVEE